MIDALVEFVSTARVVATISVVVGAFVLWWLIVRIGRRIVRRMEARFVGDAIDTARRAETLWAVVRRMAALTLVVILVLTVMSIWEISLTPLLAVGSVVGVALGFGAQNVVKDMLAGFFILAEDQFHIGDVVRVADVTGKVEDILLRVTVLRDVDGIVHYVPNGIIQVSSNFTQEFSQVVVDVGVAYGTEVDRALEVLADEANLFHADEQWAVELLDVPQVQGVQALAESSVVLRLVMKVRPDSRLPVRRELLRRIKNRFDAEGIEIPFPYRTIVPGDVAQWASVLRGSAAD